MDTLRTMQQHVTASWKQNQGLLLGTTVLVVVVGHWIWQWWWNSSSSVPSGSSHQSRLLDELNPLPTDLRLHENQDHTKVPRKTEEQKDGKQQHPEDHQANQTRPPSSTTAAETTTNTLSSSSSLSTRSTKPQQANAHGKKKKKNDSTREQHPSTTVMDPRRNEPSSSHHNNSNSNNAIVFANQSHHHPGLAGFWYWCDVESSLYRIYNLGRTDGHDVIPPYIPKSRAGRVQIHLQVTNRSNLPVNVYWTNYRGDEVYKGHLTADGGVWHQYSWIEHPWVFRHAQDGQVLLHYIPDRILPATALDHTVPTQHEQDGSGFDRAASQTGIHQFAICNPPATIPKPPRTDGSNSNINHSINPWSTETTTIPNPFCIALDDPILPFPAQHTIGSSIEDAVAWTIRHMLRVAQQSSQIMVVNWDLILQYLDKIVQHPTQAQYRRIRLANPTFSSQIWNTPARGLFLAAGFVEQGSHAELGTNGTDFPTSCVTELSQTIQWIRHWKDQWPTLLQYQNDVIQPDGAESGTGRAGFGVAGSNAFRQNQ